MTCECGKKLEKTVLLNGDFIYVCKTCGTKYVETDVKQSKEKKQMATTKIAKTTRKSTVRKKDVDVKTVVKLNNQQIKVVDGETLTEAEALNYVYQSRHKDNNEYPCDTTVDNGVTTHNFKIMNANKG